MIRKRSRPVRRGVIGTAGNAARWLSTLPKPNSADVKLTLSHKPSHLCYTQSVTVISFTLLLSDAGTLPSPGIFYWSGHERYTPPTVKIRNTESAEEA